MAADVGEPGDGLTNIVDRIMAWEAGELDPEQELVLFEDLRDNGMLYHLQGSYGRQAHRLGVI